MADIKWAHVYSLLGSKIICAVTSQNDLLVPSYCSSILMHICLEENVLSFLFLSLLLSVYGLSISQWREAVSMETWKGHLQEVVCERVQNASWIIRLAVMTDNRPQLIREKTREMGWGDQGRLLVIQQRNNRAFTLMACHTYTACISLLWECVELTGCSEMLIPHVTHSVWNVVLTLFKQIKIAETVMQSSRYDCNFKQSY